MSFTYTPGGTSDVDRVRFNTRSTDPSAPNVITDEEIADLVVSSGSWQGACAAIYWRRHGDLASVATDHSSAEGSVSYGAQLSALVEQAKRWDREAAAAATTPSDLPLAVVGELGAYQGTPSYRR